MSYPLPIVVSCHYLRKIFVADLGIFAVTNLDFRQLFQDSKLQGQPLVHRNVDQTRNVVLCKQADALN